MSEPLSLFMRVNINKENYANFMNATPGQLSINEELVKWWDSRDMYGQPRLVDEISSWNNFASNRDVINSWISFEDSMTFSWYDEVTEIWDFGIIMYTENYSEILPLIGFCQNLVKYKKHSCSDFAVIYPYFWGGGLVMAYMIFERDNMLLNLAESIADVAKEHLDYANSNLDKAWEQFS